MIGTNLPVTVLDQLGAKLAADPFIKAKGLARVKQLLLATRRKALDAKATDAFDDGERLHKAKEIRKSWDAYSRANALVGAADKEHKRVVASRAVAAAVPVAAAGIAALHHKKTANLGSIVTKPSNVGRFMGAATQNSLKAPGMASSRIAVNPRRGLQSAMNTYTA